MTDRSDGQYQNPRKRHVGTNASAAIVALLCAILLATSMMAGCGSGVGAKGQNVNASSDSNTAPVVVGVTATPERILPAGECRLVCEAVDDDGDALSYSWTASQGDIIAEGPSARWTAPDAEGLFRISVVVRDGRGGTDEYSLSLPVKNNSTPEFQSAPSYAEGIRPGATVSISCPAIDADGDAITYEWQAAYGELSGEGDTVTWVAPKDLGSYVVTVLARDTFGGEARRDVLISVTPSVTPRLGGFVVEPIGHDMLKYELGVWDIYIGESCRVECIVLEGDEPLTYAWSVDEGILTADGAMATWRAPDVRGQATIKVAVTDAHGNTNSGQLLMYAEDCTCAFD